jgi:hypothetical protein
MKTVQERALADPSWRNPLARTTESRDSLARKAMETGYSNPFLNGLLDHRDSGGSCGIS